MATANSRKQDSAVRAAKLGVIGTIAAAGITAVAALVPSLLSDDNSTASPATGLGTSIVAPSRAGTSIVAPLKNGSVTFFEVDDELARVTIHGTAEDGVTRVYVSVGPNPVTGTFWTTGASPSADGGWVATLQITPGPVPRPMKVAVIYDDGTLFPGGPPMTIISNQTRPPTDPAEEEAEHIRCLEQQGVECINDASKVLILEIPALG